MLITGEARIMKCLCPRLAAHYIRDGARQRMEHSNCRQGAVCRRYHCRMASLLKLLLQTSKHMRVAHLHCPGHLRWNQREENVFLDTSFPDWVCDVGTVTVCRQQDLAVDLVLLQSIIQQCQKGHHSVSSCPSGVPMPNMYIAWLDRVDVLYGNCLFADQEYLW